MCPVPSLCCVRPRSPWDQANMEATMLVKEAMTPEVRWFSPDTPMQEVARVMRDEGIGCVPVGENDRLVGMITDRDITCRAVAAGEPPRQADVSRGDVVRHILSLRRPDPG